MGTSVASSSLLRAVGQCFTPVQCWSSCLMLPVAAPEGSPEPQSEQLLLWALDGLSGVVINGIPNNLPGTRAASVPKAVLWGQHCSALVWAQDCR